jgi:hypothetical protein
MMMTKTMVPKLAAVAAVTLLAGCSGSSEDVRVTFCKDLSRAVAGEGAEIEWTGSDNAFRRPEYATATLTFSVKSDAGSKTMQTACYYEYDAVEDTAQHLADPFSAYATLPFAMTVDGRALADAELVKLRTAEQRRRGQAVVAGLESEARDLANKVRAGLGQ